jgi:hypothetical protein
MSPRLQLLYIDADRAGEREAEPGGSSGLVPEAGREQLRHWPKDGSIRIGPRKDGAVVAEGEILPLVVISDGGRKRNYAKPSSNGFG